MLTSRQRLVLRAFSAWTVWIWGTRIWNVVGDPSRGVAFKAVHAVLAMVSVGFAVATWLIVTRSSQVTSEVMATRGGTGPSGDGS